MSLLYTIITIRTFQLKSLIYRKKWLPHKTLAMVVTFVHEIYVDETSMVHICLMYCVYVVTMYQMPDTPGNIFSMSGQN